MADVAKARDAIRRMEALLQEAREALFDVHEDRRPREAPGAAHGTGVKVPFGRNKDLDIGDPRVPNADLQYLREATTRSLNDPSKDRYRDANEAFLRAVDAELDRRDGQGGGADNQYDDRNGQNRDADDIPF